MYLKVIWFCLLQLLTIYCSAYWACQTDDDCYYVDHTTSGNKTTRFYIECCQMVDNQRKCIYNTHSRQCQPQTTWRPRQTYPFPHTWHLQTWQTWPTLPDDRIFRFTLQHNNWTPYLSPTISIRRSKGSDIYKYVAIAFVAILFFIVIPILIICTRRWVCRSRLYPGQVLNGPATAIHQVRYHGSNSFK